MTELPHLFVRATVESDGKTCVGVSADGLPPKWFTKNRDTTFEQDDLPQMQRVIRHAADLAIELKQQTNFFLWWWQLYRMQQDWANAAGVPHLLAGFGTSLVERAVMDALCRGSGLTLFQSLRSDALGIELSVVRDALDTMRPVDFLPPTARRSVQLRHTVGLGDPLTDDEIDPTDKLDDGLPHSLVANIRRYGLRYFKIKLQGDPISDRDRLTRLATIITEHAGAEARLTLDGNEQYGDIDAFRADWEELRASTVLRNFLDRALLFVEQPLHRDRALGEDVAEGFQAWKDAPPIIIDESDADFDSLPTALRLGYSGTSHKNCKGIIKGLVNAATIFQQRKTNPGVLMSAEDLANVGPVALLQDLAMVAALGIDHVERNGHHYFAGLSMYPEEIQRRVIQNHPDLYRLNDRGFAALAPHDGRLSLGTVNESPFGVAEIPDLARLDSWEF